MALAVSIPMYFRLTTESVKDPGIDYDYWFLFNVFACLASCTVR